MKKLIFKNNNKYLEFINRYREQITVYKLDFTKVGNIRLFYDIM